MNPEGEPDTLMEQDLPVLLFQTLEKPGFLLLLIVFASQTINLGHHPHHVLLRKVDACQLDLPHSHIEARRARIETEM